MGGTLLGLWSYRRGGPLDGEGRGGRRGYAASELVGDSLNRKCIVILSCFFVCTTGFPFFYRIFSGGRYAI